MLTDQADSVKQEEHFMLSEKFYHLLKSAGLSLTVCLEADLVIVTYCSVLL